MGPHESIVQEEFVEETRVFFLDRLPELRSRGRSGYKLRLEYKP